VQRKGAGRPPELRRIGEAGDRREELRLPSTGASRARGVCTWLLPQKLDPIVSMDDSPATSVAVAEVPVVGEREGRYRYPLPRLARAWAKVGSRKTKSRSVGREPGERRFFCFVGA
jgi:hypothetical protein